MSEKGGIVSAKLCTLQCFFFFVYRTLNTHKKNKVHDHKVGRSWISEIQNPTESSSDEMQWPEKQPTPGGPIRTPRLTLRGFQQTHTGQKCCSWGGQEVSCKTM
jgi:hypothetical protein